MIWYLNEGKDDDVVIWTRIRLSRNLDGFSFPNRMDRSESEELVKTVRAAYDRCEKCQSMFDFLSVEEIPELEKKILVEKKRMSSKMINHRLNRALLIDRDETCTVMINEEDHLTIQAMFCGLETDEIWEQGHTADQMLGEELQYAYDTTFGFLTSSPTLTGTGLSISVLVHLPAMSYTGNLDSIALACEKLHLSMKALSENGKKAPGAFFVLSNEKTIGESESDLIQSIKQVIEQIAEQERALRRQLTKQMGLKMEDRVFRSLGTFLNARLITYEESLALMNDIRFGVYVGMIGNFGIKTLNELLVNIKPAILQKYKGMPLMMPERDAVRAEMIRHKLEKFFRKGEEHV